MLTLERKEGEATILTIGDIRIRIEIDHARDAKAKFEIDTPEEVAIIQKGVAV